MHHQSQHQAGQARGSGEMHGHSRMQGSNEQWESAQYQEEPRRHGGEQFQGDQPQGTGQFQSTGQRQRSIQAGGPQFATRNYLPEDVRVATCQRLNQVLADTTALRMEAKYAHWNVKGLQFFQLHELFEEIADALAEQEDLIAERITALGGRANGTVQQAAATNRVGEIPPETTTGRAFVRELANCLAAHDADLYEDIRAAEEYDDLDTADMLNEISREVSHYLWFLEAHLQGRPESEGRGGQGQWAQGTSW